MKPALRLPTLPRPPKEAVVTFGAAAAAFAFVLLLVATLPFAGLRYGRARFYEGRGRYPLALREYERFLARAPEDPRAVEAHVRAGELYAWRFQRCGEARRHFEAAGRLASSGEWGARARAGIMNCPDYFPLEPGRTWVYGDTQSGGKFMRLEWELREAQGGARGIVLSSMYAGNRRLKSASVVYEKRDWMVVELGADGKGGPILRYPFRVGESWTAVREGQRLSYRVESENETVATKAGTFEGCIKVREVNARLPKSYKYDYYAPFVGRVKTTVGGPGFENPNTELIRFSTGA